MWGHLYAQRVPFHNLNVDDGLIQSQATCMTQDKVGNLWIGTLGGLSRYDGRNFTNYTVKNGLLNSTIWAVAIDSNEQLWIGSQAGISRFDGRHFIHYTKQPQTVVSANRALNNTQQIQIVGDTTWWRVQGDVYFITRGKIKYYVSPGPAGFITSILAEKDGLWIAKEGTIYHLHGSAIDSVRFPVNDDQRAPGVFRIFRDRGGRIWLTTSAGLYSLDNNRIQPVAILHDNQAVTPLMSSVTQDHTGSLWLATSNGVIKLEPGKTPQLFSKHNGLSDNSFFDIFTDAEGNVWMASDGQGIFRFSGTLFTGLDERMGLPSAQIMAIASNGRDSLFLGTYDAGLYTFVDGKVSPLSFPSSPVPSITSLCYARNSTLWIGTRGRGLWSYAKGTFRQYATPERDFPSNFVNHIYEDTAGRLWIGFANGVMLFANDSFKSIPVKNAAVVSFLAIGADSMLIATERGLQLYSAGEVADFHINSIVDSSSVQCFTLQGRNLWMGTSDNGVIRYNLSSRKTWVINKSSGLRSDFIYNIIADDDGNIWVGTGFGIHKISVDAKNDYRISFYGKLQGVTGMESNINAVLKLPDASIWFGTTNGALHYQPHSEVVSSRPTSIVMQSVKLLGEPVIDKSYYDSTDIWYGIPYNLRLPYKKNNITFTFQAITLSGAQQVLYRYRMEGLETPWSDWSPTNSVTYSALPPGKYVFHVQCNGGNDQKNTELVYSFEIITPFQKTTLFRLIVLAACILSGILLQFLMNLVKEKRKKLLARLRSEEQAKIRLRTAEDFHDEIGNRLTRINVLTNVLKSKISQTADTDRILGQIEENTDQLYGGTRDILWSLKPSNDNLFEILHRIRDFGGELFQDTNVNFIFRGSDPRWKNYRLPLDMSRNLIMIFKEALNNALKYAHAKNVILEISLKNKTNLHIVLKDDGQGFDIQTVKRGNGIANMNTRAERLNGKLYIDSRPEKGTIITLSFKIPPNR